LARRTPPFSPASGFLELALAATAGMDLGLDDPERAVEFARRRLGVFGLQTTRPSETGAP
jgi:hypothetical protein